MQVRTTLTRRYESHRFLALAAGIVLAAVLILGVVALNLPADSPIVERGANTAAPVTTDGTGQIAFLEQNVWEYAAAPVNGIEQIRFLEQNDFEHAGAPPASIERTLFLEQNDWDYVPQAQFAREAEEPVDVQNFRFIEANVWEYASDVMLPNGDAGELVY